MTRKVCVVTGTRAEYGLLRWVMDRIRQSRSLQLQVVATGMHLSPEFGLTHREIEKDGFRIDRKVEMLLSSDTPSAVTKSMGVAMIGFADALEELSPDIMMVLGDRFELLAAAAAAMVARVPVAHLHGGESTEGVIDEAIRHSITKMSHVHFVAAEEYAQRVVQLGEHPDSVHVVGGLGLDNLEKLTLLDRVKLEEAIGMRLGRHNVMVTFHPVTLEAATAEQQMTELLAALDSLDDTHVIFTMPNSDTDGRVLFGMIEEYVASHPGKACAHTSLGQIRYLSALRHVDAVVGNSSSGLIEAPALRKGTVNIGDRQTGRLRADSVIDCEPDRASIAAAIARSRSPAFQEKLKSVRNPYGSGGASARVVETLEKMTLEGILKKRFYDLPSAAPARP